VLQKIKQALGPLPGKRIAALGLAYKADVDDLRESPSIEVVHLLQQAGAQVKAWEPFKPAAEIEGVHMAKSFEACLQDAESIVLLVRHTQFLSLDPQEVAARTPARIVLDCVNGWNTTLWENAGFVVHRLGVNKPDLVNQQS
jgi:UDP-N-acetyl-D-mannosaminuronic acid dehydrogenase